MQDLPRGLDVSLLHSRGTLLLRIKEFGSWMLKHPGATEPRSVDGGRVEI